MNFNKLAKILLEDLSQKIILSHNPYEKEIVICCRCDVGGKEKKKWKSKGYDLISHGYCDYHVQIELDKLDSMEF